MAYRLSRRAEDDILRIFLEGAIRFGAAQAEACHHELSVVLDMIAAHPEMARERVEIAPPVRIHPHKAHIVIYHQDDAGDVLIIRVRHAQEDWENTE